MQSDALICLVIQIAFGLVGAFIVASFCGQYRPGLLGLFIAGIVGGGLGGQLLGLMLGGSGPLAVVGHLGRLLIPFLHGGSGPTMPGATGSDLDTGTILAQIVGGAIGGALLTLIAALGRQTVND